MEAANNINSGLSSSLFFSYSLFSSFHLTSKSNLIFTRYCTALEPTCASEKSREFAWNCIIQCSRLCSRLWCDVMHSVPTKSMWCCCCFHLHGGGREFLPFVRALSENCWWLWESVHTINLVDLLCVLEEWYKIRKSEVLLLFRFYLLKTNHKLRVASSILYERDAREEMKMCWQGKHNKKASGEADEVKLAAQKESSTAQRRWESSEHQKEWKTPQWKLCGFGRQRRRKAEEVKRKKIN